jgi:hypothetical protein
MNSNIEDLITTAITNPGQLWGWLVSQPKDQVVGVSCSTDNCTVKRFLEALFNLEAEVSRDKISVLIPVGDEGEYVDVVPPRWLQWFLDDHDKIPQIQRINADMALFMLERAVHLDRELPPEALPSSNPPHYAVANHHHSFSYLEGGQSIMPFADGHTYRSLRDANAQAQDCLKEGYTINEIKIYRLVAVPAYMCDRYSNVP